MASRAWCVLRLPHGLIDFHNHTNWKRPALHIPTGRRTILRIGQAVAFSPRQSLWRGWVGCEMQVMVGSMAGMIELVKTMLTRVGT